jgi:hypothetical protein
MPQTATQTQQSPAPTENSEDTIIANERAWKQVGDLPCKVTIEVPVRGSA